MLTSIVGLCSTFPLKLSQPKVKPRWLLLGIVFHGFLDSKHFLLLPQNVLRTAVRTLFLK